VSTCERLGCERVAVWAMTHSVGPTARWCERHTIRFPGHRKRAFIPAGSPQLTLSEVSVL